MKQKCGQWYADWRDETGRRLRKAFPTRREAKKYAEAMRKKAEAKKAQRRA